jgi:hypothetical protein
VSGGRNDGAHRLRLTGRSVDRAEQTRDADILVDICSSPSILTKVVNELTNYGFQPMESFGREFARCTFTNSIGQGQIDVLCPEDATGPKTNLNRSTGCRAWPFLEVEELFRYPRRC